MKLTDSILVGADIAPPRERFRILVDNTRVPAPAFDYFTPKGSNVAYPADHPIVTAMPKDEQRSYTHPEPVILPISGALPPKLGCVPSPPMKISVEQNDLSRHYLSFDDVLRINKSSPLRLVWNAVDRYYAVYAWTNDLDENGGNLKGIIRDEEFLRNGVKIPYTTEHREAGYERYLHTQWLWERKR